MVYIYIYISLDKVYTICIYFVKEEYIWLVSQR